MASGWQKLPGSFIDADLRTFRTFGELKVELALRRYANSDGICWPSITTLAEVTGMDRGNVCRAINSLISVGRIIRMEIGKSSSSTRYRIIGSGAGATDVVADAQQPSSGPGATVVVAPAHKDSGPGATLTDIRTDLFKQTPEKTIDEKTDEIWKASPKTARDRSSRKDLKTALKKFPKDFSTILKSLSAWKRSPDWAKDEGKYIPGIHRFITKEKWRDMPEVEPADDDFPADGLNIPENSPELIRLLKQVTQPTAEVSHASR